MPHLEIIIPVTIAVVLLLAGALYLLVHRSRPMLTPTSLPEQGYLQALRAELFSYFEPNQCWWFDYANGGRVEVRIYSDTDVEIEIKYPDGWGTWGPILVVTDLTRERLQQAKREVKAQFEK